jgi:uncharacterized cupredoxin-like copper-binding protein
MGVARHRRAAAWAVFGAVSLLAGSGCGEASQKNTEAPAVTVKERDFRIAAPKRMAPGPAQLRVENRGPDAHELIVVPGRSRDLRISSDGINVDEELLEKRGAKELEAADPSTRTLKVDLKPGHYVLLCNMTGHFQGGMHTEVLVH